MAPLIWFITGCSTGFGRELVRVALARGDKVIATARNATKLESLKEEGADTMPLDVTASLDDLKNSAEKAHSLYGRIDVLVNVAGYVMEGTLEELTPAETQAQFDTNVFGLLNVTRAFLPYFRAQRSGTIGNVSSIGAWRGSAGAGLYTTSKWAVSGISETLTAELADFNIKVCAIEPGYFRSNLLNPGNRTAAKAHIPDYDGTAARKTAEGLEAYNNNQPGDIVKGAKVMVDVLTSSGVAAGREVPLRLALGSDAYGIITEKCRETISLLDEWKDVTTTTDHE